MKNIIIVTDRPIVSATFQDVLDRKGDSYHTAVVQQDFENILIGLSPKKPDLIMVTSYASDPLAKAVVSNFPDLHDRMVIMAMNHSVDQGVLALAPVQVYQRSNHSESEFFKRCREILGE